MYITINSSVPLLFCSLSMSSFSFVSFLMLEAVQMWMGRNCVWFNPTKSAPPKIRFSTSSFKNGKHLRVFLDSQSLLSEKLERPSCSQLHVVCQLQSPRSVTHALITLWLNSCNAVSIGLPLKTTWEIQLVQSVVAQALIAMPWYVHVTPLLHNCTDSQFVSKCQSRC